MKQLLQAGGMIEVLSGAEHKQESSRTRNLVRRALASPHTMQGKSMATSDGSGNLGGGLTGPGAEVFRVSMGRRAQLHRLTVTGPGTPAQPSTSGYLLFSLNEPDANGPDFFFPQPGQTQVSPAYLTEGSDGLFIPGGVPLVVLGVGLAASTAYYFRYQYVLFDDPEAPEPEHAAPILVEQG